KPRQPGQALYSDLIVVPGFERAAMAALRSWLAEHIVLWDELRFLCVPASSLLSQGFNELAQGWSPRMEVHHKVYVDTSMGWTDYRSRLSKRQQRHLRYEPNALAREAGSPPELVVHRGKDV